MKNYSILFWVPDRLVVVAALLLVTGPRAEAGGNRLSSLASTSSSSGNSNSTASLSQTATAATSLSSQSVQTTALAQRAQASLQKSLAIFQAQQAAQNAARSAAQSATSSVPNGLVIINGQGGLVPDSGLSQNGVANAVTTWVNAQTPTQTISHGLTKVTVTQTGQQALLNWQTFNIGADTTLAFDQSAGGANVAQWVAINKVAANIAPSEILGSITAQGQVYVINQNGIIFGGTSQVNVGALVASSLPINDNLVNRGLLNNPDLQFLFSQSNLPAGTLGPTPAFKPQSAPSQGTVASVDSLGNLYLNSASGHDGDVVVQAGAKLTSTTTAEHVGGKIALVGPNVTNAGIISTPDGQTILAAGNQVGFTSHDSNDPSLRGLDVYVGKVDSSSGVASNPGLIESPRADITMVGKVVNQNGVIDSSTSVSLNGRVDLLAEYNSTPFFNGVGSFTGTSDFFPETSGSLNLSSGSLIQILPEWSSTDRVVGTKLALSSLVNLQGQSVSLGQNSLLWAPSADVPADSSKPALAAGGLTLNSGVTVNAGQWLAKSGAYSFYNTEGEISLAEGATLDVSGSQNVAASVTENIVTGQLLGTELANSPLQKDGALRGQTIQFDLRQTGVNSDGTAWIGTPVGDVSGYVNLVQHSVGELTTKGGTASLKAGEAVNLNSGSTIDVSGGWISYQGGTIQTTKIVAQGGQVLDISQASANRVYEGIYTGYTTTSKKWGVSTSDENSLKVNATYEAGYIQGGNGGSLAISAPTMTLNGKLFGNTVAGTYQRSLASQLSTTYAGATFLATILQTQALPTASTLQLDFESQNPAQAQYPIYSPTPANIDFGVSRKAGDLVLSPDLINKNGFGQFTITNSDGSIYLPEDVTLTTSAGGAISFYGATIDIEGKVNAPDGSLNFTAYDFSPYVDTSGFTSTPPPDSTRGNFILGPTASLSTAGFVIDDRSTSVSAGTLPLAINGGSVSINSFSADLSTGSLIDVSGGAEATGTNKVTYGLGGQLSISAGQDPGITSLVGGTLQLKSNLKGYSGSTAGSLTILAPLIQIGGTAVDPSHTLQLTSDFFSQGGFGSFSLAGLGKAAPNQSNGTDFLPAVSIASGTTITPQISQWVANLDGENGFTLSARLLPLASQRTPANLTFSANGVKGLGGGLVVRGDFVMDEGAAITTDPKGSITISGSTVEVLGKINAPGGTISISGAKNSTGLFSNAPDPLDPLVTVELGSDSLLSTAGTVEITPNAYGYKTGQVLDGGKIKVSGNILAEKGAVMDVRGTSGMIDVAPSQTSAPDNRISTTTLVSTLVASNGGSIILSGGQELFSAAEYRGTAGGFSAQGGCLSLSSQLYDPTQGDIATTPLDATLEVAQGTPSYLSNGIGSTVQIKGSTLGLGYFTADSFNSSGLDALTLAGTVEFSGPVTLIANRSLTIGDGGVISSDAAVNLQAPYVKLGQAFQGPLSIAQQQLPIYVDSKALSVQIEATSGNGSITVKADSLIDVGNLSLQNTGALDLVALNGDVRGDGTLDVAGDIAITAGQVYPTTDTTFTIAAHGTDGAITISGSGKRQTPLSAGGTLNIFAADITQGGVLRSPLGTINLGSGVTEASPTDSLSGETFDSTQKLTLLSGSITSVSAIDSVTGQALTIPYGTNPNGNSWYDPAGNDITASGNGSNGVPDKAVRVSAVHVDDQAGASIDLRGGGDFYAYRFVSGTGGTTDILNTTTSFAVLPNYSANYAPFYSSTDYTNAKLNMGDQVYLNASSGLPAGVYTLLPARYASLPGAYLITPKSGTPVATSTIQADGSTLVSGYRFNSFDKSQTVAPLLTSFEVANSSVVSSRAEYDNYSANTYLGQSAKAQGISVRLPQDAGQLVLAATKTMTIHGSVLSQAASGGLGSLVDLASPSDILISGPGTNLSEVNPDTLVLNSSDLSDFGADSLLIGGYRSSAVGGTGVTVTTNNLLIDNAGATLTGPDIILVSNDNLTLAADAGVEQKGTLSSPAESLAFGTAQAATGNGVLLRVSSDASAQISRSSVDTSGQPSLVVGNSVTVSGASLILDSTADTTVDSSAKLSGKNVALDSGEISLVLDDSHPTSGLVLTAPILEKLQASAQSLSLLSYKSIDIYEKGVGAIGSAADASGHYAVQSLTLHAQEINGIGGGAVSINAAQISLDNSTGGVLSSLGNRPLSGELTINAHTIQLGGGAGTNQLDVNGYANLNLNATGGIYLAATQSTAKDSSGNKIQGSSRLTTSGDLQMTTPGITGATGANETITAKGALQIVSPANGPTISLSGGLGATLSLVGTSVTENSLIQLASGKVSIEATGAEGNITVGGTLDVGGTAQTFNDLVKYTSGGQVNLTSDSGSVFFNTGSKVAVNAYSGGGNGGSLAISAKNGTFTFAGSTMSGAGGTDDEAGNFSLDVRTIASGSLQTLDTTLDAGGFTQSISIRDRNDATILIDGAVKAASYQLSADQGSITVTGTIDASNVAAKDSTGNKIQIGGTIALEASQSLTLASGSELNVAGHDFNNAGKGGSITLEAGAETKGSYDSNAYLTIQSGSTIDLSVAAADDTSAMEGQFSGTLHLRAPQLTDGTDLQINPINGKILGASSILVEGYKIFDATADGSIDNHQESNVLNNGQAFAGNTTAILNRILNPRSNPNSANLQAITDIAPGAEIISTTGDLNLANDWDLSSYRFGPNSTAGVLTLRSSGNLIFTGSLSDGFSDFTNTATVLSQNSALPVNLQSWSYRLVAGADLSAADFHQVQTSAETYDPATGLARAGKVAGSLELGNFVTQNNGNATASGGANAQTSSALSGYYQVIRTGTGDIDISTAGDVLLQNQFATIFTSGVQAAPLANFDTPVLKIGNQTFYEAQYTLAGGNVTINAQGNIAHVTQDSSGTIVLDSEKELPNNWLYRRGYVDSASGQFGLTKNKDHASTSWWVDFSNFFEGIGALGGGNLTLSAGHDISNVDAVAPTNARMTYTTASGDNLAADQPLLELGGGDVVVNAGYDINGGAYYVERGQSKLAAGNSLITNYTRSASLGTITSPSSVNDRATWLPTTLFLGKGSFDVTAQNDLLLGPVANPFLLPQGYNNTYWDKTYFSTYATTDAVNLTSLTGSVTLRESATLVSGTKATPLLQNWFQSVDLFASNPPSLSYYQPWLRLTETSVDPFSTVDTILPGTIRATSFSGDIDTIGNLTLSPSPYGTVDLLAAGSINSLQANGISGVIDSSNTGTTTKKTWSSSTINLSDANPAAIPGVNSPYAYEAVVGTAPAAALTSNGTIKVGGVNVSVSLDLSFINSLFDESGSTEGTYGVLQTKLKLHSSIDGAPLHANDLNPVHLYAETGDISGLTLFSAKSARLVSGEDISDIALYVQNTSSQDTSIVAAGRDLIAYDANSPLRVSAQASGNVLDLGSNPLAGDIQITGPGTLEVLAGRNLNLGAGPTNSDGTGVGISSLGNARNPVLPFGGADIVALAGVGASSGLDGSKLNFTDASGTGFIDLFLNPTTGGTLAARYLADLGVLLGLPSSDSTDQIWTSYYQLSSERQKTLALDVFYLVLRDSGRDNTGIGGGNYETAYKAIAALFPGNRWQGDISLTSREIKTANGGNINLLAPGGKLEVGLNIPGTDAADQGILTEDGGNISIFTQGNVDVGTSRIFTLHGGNEIIWSTDGDIAAGASSKTVQSAPPTRVLIDPQSGAVQTDLAGLATGGGIGVLKASPTAPPANVDLIAPKGTVDPGDAGIRVSGNLNIAAQQILNAGNIQVGGKSSGVPTVIAPNVAGLTAASATAGATTSAADQVAKQARSGAVQTNQQNLPSIITVEVLGYGGNSTDTD